MTTSRLERAIARLNSMNHEEYANFLKKHTKSYNCDVSFAYIGDVLLQYSTSNQENVELDRSETILIYELKTLEELKND